MDLLPDGRPALMGIVNITPDSFSDGGQFYEVQDAINHVQKLISAGADIIDIGGESTRPGAAPVTPKEELRRTMGRLAYAVETGTLVSIDTRNA
ncbi:MAG: dihydropteroate synthase, partial [Rhodospirillaceae bacterium]|nr:dihydropteroate synthase [Rhodospirillaceae bacterium]